MRKKVLLLLLLCGLITSCNPYRYSSYDDPPKGATVTFYNPIPYAKKAGATGNNFYDFVNLQATIIVSAADVPNTALVQYSVTTKEITPSMYGTPQIITVSGVNVPEKGPLSIQVFLKAKTCTEYLNNCTNVGGRPEYYDSFDVSSTGSAPQSYSNFNLKLTNRNCC